MILSTQAHSWKQVISAHRDMHMKHVKGVNKVPETSRGTLHSCCNPESCLAIYHRSQVTAAAAASCPSLAVQAPYCGTEAVWQAHKAEKLTEVSS